MQGDATDPATVDRALAGAVRAFGGLDVLVVNAGVFPAPQPLADLADDAWAKTLGINAGGALTVLRAAHPFLRVSPVGGSVVVVASKNVPAPGTGAGAYSASKAALTQLARIAALEWGRDGIRVNVLHPDAVFDTALWTDDLIAERAAGYGLTPEQYRRRNVLGAEVDLGARGRGGGGSLRPDLRPDHRGADRRRRRQRPGDLTGAAGRSATPALRTSSRTTEPGAR